MQLLGGPAAEDSPWLVPRAAVAAVVVGAAAAAVEVSLLFSLSASASASAPQSSAAAPTRPNGRLHDGGADARSLQLTVRGVQKQPPLGAP